MIAVVGFDFVFIDAAGLQVGAASVAHGVVAAVPCVEIANHTHAPRIGGPNGKTCAEAVVDAVVIAFVVQVNIAERGRKGIGIDNGDGVPVWVGNVQ